MMMMRLNRLIANVIFIVGVMSITGGCTTDAVEPTEQLVLYQAELHSDQVSSVFWETG